MEEQYMNYTPQDFKSDQEVRWCPGCGDHAILNAVQKALPEVSKQLKYNLERYVFVSGIGCSSRFPYYVNTFGFHGIHGRASAIATGVKVANPTLSVWQVTGDGDALAIGGNHFIHAVRRNIDINILLFNNQIYGLTKGQYSPTSPLGAITKTSPFGTVEHPFRPGELVIGAQGKFFARSLDVDVKLTAEIMVEAAKHDGTSVVEILQNCVIFNDGAYDYITDREHRDDRVIVLRHGEKMVFGKNRDKGLILSGLSLKVVTIGQGGFTMDDILVHDAYNPNPGVHMMLANMEYPDYPVALGVIRNVKDSTYDDNVRDQVLEVMKTAKIKSVDDLLNSGDTWEV
ncbi:MAG: 2-oxoacid:ferredoxin oxidoreductase subunit beta [Tenuifilum sp.]|jgi:2-oxoglutarate ferredoxin oxidoreductase subunit beta|uniref:2-oxoacid:ferredoxin oxidoreductase subunit beta n=1 Tax=Tenuifilum sp. TaxID=2760880 RepID=UPI001B61E99E|nr:2-oxoacid:ferredoxin oxidoreductase subunit beta [Bacteroidales bacterium]HON69819.1 2-oxoacid:ferredoxin oxidoreductase subunit beta [Tenuifilum sp.]MBP9029098.1 2-oxoacid:ferredoxin oxidoreductase subunit beta [Bacteroidales bacterium]HOU73388.1 2-oxoacid:ferredoxin oxidoreductase subunit beta [Tenuifilum sp.]HPP89344.1 2-oxoacid:ferredoxin oxidoreductase subunit beta [Tenuifilum sp.]